MVDVSTTLALEDYEQVLLVLVVKHLSDVLTGRALNLLKSHDDRKYTERVMPPEENPQEIPLLRNINRLPPASAMLPHGDARERPLFTRAEVAELLEVPVLDVLKLAAAYDIGWVQSTTGIGPQFSARAVKQMIRATLTMHNNNGESGLARFDRAALVWYMLEDQPNRSTAPPVYKQRFEQELTRVAKLDEPARTLRIAELQAAWKDAKVIAGSLQQPML